MPPISSRATRQWHPGRFVWLELVTPDATASRRFYGELLGWKFRRQEGYLEILNGERRIGGIIELKPEKREKVAAQWLATLSIADLDRALEMVKEQGGKVINGPVAMQQRGNGALVSDPWGATLVLLRAREGDPPEQRPEIGDWLWVEEWTCKLGPVSEFYRKLGGYSEVLKEPDYAVLINEGKWRAGIRQIKDPAYAGRWVPAVRVENAALLAARVEALGGRVLIRPDQSPENPETALITDNSGALLILQPWTFAGGKP